MLEKSCFDFLESLASKEPVPGGGGATALVGSIGIALGMMVGNLTAGKKKYADVEDEIQYLIKKSGQLKNRLNDLVLQDAIAFEPLSKAYGLPSDTEEERLYKDKVMQEALLIAAKVPLDIAECCLEGIKLLEHFAKKGSRLVFSDAGVGVILCKSALQGAKLCVLINLKLMKDEDLIAEYNDKINRIETEGVILADKIYKYVEEELCC